jgi:hypothetical protein
MYEDVFVERWYVFSKLVCAGGWGEGFPDPSSLDLLVINAAISEMAYE